MISAQKITNNIYFRRSRKNCSFVKNAKVSSVQDPIIVGSVKGPYRYRFTFTRYDSTQIVFSSNHFSEPSCEDCTIAFRSVETRASISIKSNSSLLLTNDNSKTHSFLSRCIKKMDHHCPWINACVGHKNHAHFIRFLFYAATGCFYGGTNLAATIVKIVFYVSVK